MPLFFLSLEPGSDSDTYLYQETLYLSRRSLWKTAPEFHDRDDSFMSFLIGTFPKINFMFFSKN